jgi:hypothetical protein
MNDHIETLTTEAIAKVFHWRNRQQISLVAKQEKWRFVGQGGKGPIQRSYYAEDVAKYARVRQRKMLAKAMSESYKIRMPLKLIRTTKYDLKCPECGEFAMILPPAVTGRDPIEYLNQMEAGTRPWACLNGHSLSKRVKLPPNVKYSELPWHLLDEKEQTVPGK